MTELFLPSDESPFGSLLVEGIVEGIKVVLAQVAVHGRVADEVCRCASSSAFLAFSHDPAQLAKCMASNCRTATSNSAIKVEAVDAGIIFNRFNIRAQYQRRAEQIRGSESGPSVAQRLARLVFRMMQTRPGLHRQRNAILTQNRFQKVRLLMNRVAKLGLQVVKIPAVG